MEVKCDDLPEERIKNVLFQFILILKLFDSRYPAQFMQEVNELVSDVDLQHKQYLVNILQYQVEK